LVKEMRDRRKADKLFGGLFLSVFLS